MPYQDVIGHTPLVQLLSRSVRRGSLPPSLILAGPAGVGKRLIALATAQALNCLSPRDYPSADGLDACGVCPACTRIARGVYPDVPIVEPGDTGSIKIEQVRDIVDKAGYRPFEGRRRVVIFDDADAMAPAAQNALLKMLEEPPPSTVFMLITARPDLLLITVRSRCPVLRFRPLGPREVAAALTRQGRSEAEARAVAATADGSVGHALAASGGELLEARDTAARVLAQAATGADPRRRLDSAKELLVKTGGGGAADREQLAAELRAMASLVRDVALLSVLPDGPALANPDVQPALARLTAFRGDRGLRAFATIDRALAALDRNAGVKVVADWVALRL